MHGSGKSVVKSILMAILMACGKVITGVTHAYHSRGMFFPSFFLMLPVGVGQVEEKLEREDNKGKGKQRGSFRKFLGSFLTPVFLEVGCDWLVSLLGFRGYTSTLKG